MLLKSGSSKATISVNIGEMRRAGYPEKQAVAASMRKAGKKKSGRAQKGANHLKRDGEYKK